VGRLAVLPDQYCRFMTEAWNGVDGNLTPDGGIASMASGDPGAAAVPDADYGIMNPGNFQ